MQWEPTKDDGVGRGRVEVAVQKGSGDKSMVPAAGRCVP